MLRFDFSLIRFMLHGLETRCAIPTQDTFKEKIRDYRK